VILKSGLRGRRPAFEPVRVAAKRIVPFWVIAVIIGSFLPGSLKGLVGTMPFVPNHAIEWQHRLAHFVTFGATAVLFLLTKEKRRDEVALAGAAFLLGCVIEFAQFAAGFSIVFEWWDVRDDLIAALVGLTLFEAIRFLLVVLPGRSS
jgi:hypothetical protein